MAPFFQKRLSCFYCGLRSTQSQKGPIRQWECKECDAVNYLDEVCINTSRRGSFIYFISISMVMCNMLSIEAYTII